MKSRILRSASLAVVLAFSFMAFAHHPPQMDHCASFSFSGEIERIEWRPPHVQLIVRAEDGTSYTVTWLAINQLGLAGIERDTLRVGDRVEVTAGVFLDDRSDRPLLLSYIYRESDGWGWSQRPQGC